MIKYLQNIIQENCYYTKWTHTAILYQVEEDFIIIAESLPEGFVKTTYLRYKFENEIKKNNVMFGKINGLSKERIKRMCDKYIGSPYDWVSIYGLGFKFFFGRDSILSRFFKGPSVLICSEAVARIYYDASFGKINLVKEFNKDLDFITPVDWIHSKHVEWINGR